MKPDPNSLPIPHNAEAEKAVLGALLLNNDIAEDVFVALNAKDFYSPQNATIYAKCEELWNAGKPIELTLLADALKVSGQLDVCGGYLYLAGLEQSVVTTGAAPELARIIAEKAVLRRVMMVADAALREASGEADPGKIIAKAIKSLDAIGDGDGTELPMVPICESVISAVEMIEQRLAGSDSSGMRWYWSPFDGKRMHVQAEPGDVTIIAARPSLGKSALVMQLMLEQARCSGDACLFFNLEMGARQVGMRMMSSKFQCDFSSMFSSEFVDKRKLEQFRVFAEESKSLRIYQNTRQRMTVEDIAADIKRMKKVEPSIKWVYIDYLQLIAPSGKSGNANQDVSHISRAIKLMAGEFGVHMVALSQLNRDIERRKGAPTLADLRDSGSLEQDASNIFFLHSDKPREDRELDAVDVDGYLLKNRNGPTGKITLRLNTHSFRFELPDDGRLGTRGGVARVQPVQYSSYKPPFEDDDEPRA